MLPNQWDELLRSNQKRHRINKTQQPQDDEPRQPIRIPECEKLLEDVFLIHCRAKNAQRRTSNVQRSILDHFGSWKSEIGNDSARGEIRTPDQPLKLSGLLYHYK